MRFEASVAYSDRSKGLFGAVAVLGILICFKVSKFCVRLVCLRSNRQGPFSNVLNIYNSEDLQTGL